MVKSRLHKHQEVGFTLIEQLISLMIFMILILMITPFAFNRLSMIEEKQFLNVISHDILYAQNMAIQYPSHYTRLHLYPTHYEILTGHKVEHTVKRSIPKGWSISNNSFSEISFSKTGTIRQAGTITIKTSKNVYDLVLPLGKGREYIVKR